VTEEGGIISGVSISHTRASHTQLETATASSQSDLVATLLTEPGVEEVFALQTCNRVEAYVVTDDATDGRNALESQFSETPDEIIQAMGHEESLRHLLRVAAGLDSLVLGEDQILGQVREAYEDARTAGGIGPLLEDGVTKAIRVGERARNETEINEGVVSLASAAVRLAREKHGFDGATAVIIGAGEMGTLAAKRLAGDVDHLVVANRTISNADRVVETVQPTETTVESMGLDTVSETLPAADVVISATGSPVEVVEADDLAGAGETFVVDIAQPRDIPQAADELENLTVYDLDRLEAVTEKTRQRRRLAAERVETIVDDEFERLLSQYKRKRADDVISAMYESAERVKATELETTFGKLDLDEEDEAVIESMADAIVSQLLAAPTDSLRDAAEEDDWSTIHTALNLFDPNFAPEDEGGPPDFVTDMNPEDIPESVKDDIPAAVLEQIED